MDGLDLVNLNILPKAALRRKLVLGSGLCVVLFVAEYYGLISGFFKWLRRSAICPFLGYQPIVHPVSIRTLKLQYLCHGSYIGYAGIDSHLYAKLLNV